LRYRRFAATTLTMATPRPPRKVRWAEVILTGLLATLVVGSFLPFWQSDAWFVRLWDFPRLQIAVALALVMAQLLWLRRGRWRRIWISLGAGLAAIVWQLSHVGPYMPLAPKSVASVANCPPQRALTLLNVNVLQDNREYMAVVALIKRTNPDVVLLLETGPEWRAVLAPLAARYPFSISEPVPNTYGMVMLSKLPVKARVVHRMQPAVPSIDAEVKLRSGDLIAFHGVHPEPPVPGNDSGQRDAELVMVGRQVRASQQAAIVMGDLNDVAWSRTSRLFRRLSGMNDPRAGRGLYPTFNAKYAVLRWPLDHLFVTPHFGLLAMKRLGKVGSDHFPMFYSLCLTKDAGRRLNAPQADPDARKDAAEEVREGQQAQSDEARGN
jgi:endonuclease/exonuclease/phosphatase (EEP) superfamily protein YafD